MKKLSLVTAIAISSIATCAIANDSLEDAFKNTKASGVIKAVHFDSNFLGKTESDSMSMLGGRLNVTTGEFYNTKIAATFQTSHELDSDIKNGVFTDTIDAGGSVLSEIYLDAKLSNTSVKIGRQFINTPIVSSAIDGKSSESIIKDSFEAIIVSNTDIKDTVITLGYVSKYQPQTDSLGDPGKFKDYGDGAFTFYLKNNSIENLTLQAQYLDVSDGDTYVSDDFTVSYLQADYQLGKHTLSAQYFHSSDDTAANEDGNMFGLQATGPLGLGKLGYLVAYNSSTDDGAVLTGAGAGTTDTAFTAMPVHGGGVPARADTDTIVGAIVIPVMDVTFIPYAGKSMCDTGLGDVDAMGAMAIYPFYKNALLKLNYENVQTQNVYTEDTDTFRAYLSYSF